MEVTMLVDESTILINVHAKHKEEVLQLMSNNLVAHGFVNKSFTGAVIAREHEFPTGLPMDGMAVAIPHTDIEHVRKKTISIAQLNEPVEFGVMGGTASERVAVKLVFMLAMEEAHSQLTILQQLMKLFQNNKAMTQLAYATSKREIKTVVLDHLGTEAKGGRC
ncbi:PTS sugar transporter subunit IIA [Shouchella clausii]|jgi:galactitol PTS system EIIA component|uniref:PTS sugar transporter subunit IIA n=1 Tax=Shouchella TaxID=2893057 RepID=UPI000689ED99|nr:MULTISPECIES: PTS sugar transporter subunit IIA [Shouchella]MBU3229675.1 PTS sugar transporter subunit IIA [Shouchella clausii]MBU3264241.1 PTS sugar transporter subunit IIA [Shouchella clausii]MBU3506576.1 PTS sugar transporter subunit IIA [Shouchella clausii]MBU3533835.1 PTS sugar transporter subunit IIA [Shouchella clausii]MBX0307626.1 PTS sugar transporter subunit IIA [Shouchella clausii]